MTPLCLYECRSDEEMVKFMQLMNSIWNICGKDAVTAFDLSPFKVICDLGGKCVPVCACDCVFIESPDLISIRSWVQSLTFKIVGVMRKGETAGSAVHTYSIHTVECVFVCVRTQKITQRTQSTATIYHTPRPTPPFRLAELMTLSKSVSFPNTHNSKSPPPGVSLC